MSQRLLEVLNRILVVTPEAHADLRDRGLVYQRLEAFRAAAEAKMDRLLSQADDVGHRAMALAEGRL